MSFVRTLRTVVARGRRFVTRRQKKMKIRLSARHARALLDSLDERRRRSEVAMFLRAIAGYRPTEQRS